MSKEPLPVGAGTRCGGSMRSCACVYCKVGSCWSVAWCRTSVPTVACSARKGVMRRGCLTGRDDRKSDRFAADERKAGERTGVVNAPVHPTNARSAGIFKGLRPGTMRRSFRAHGSALTLKIRKSQCLQGFLPTSYRPQALFLPRFLANFVVKAGRRIQ